MSWRCLRAFGIASALCLAVLVLTPGCGRKAHAVKAPAPFEEALYDADPTSEAGKLVARALELRRSRRCAEAIQLYEKALTTPITLNDAAAIRIAKANTYTLAGDYKADVKESDTVIRMAVTPKSMESTTAVMRANGAIQAKVWALSLLENKPRNTVLAELDASASAKERPVFLLLSVNGCGARGDLPGAKTNILRLIHDYPKTPWAEMAQFSLDAMEYGPAGENPFAPRSGSGPNLSPAAQAQVDKLHELARARKDAEFLPLAKRLLPTLPKGSSEVPLLRRDMAESFMRTNDPANARKEAVKVIAMAHADTDFVIMQGTSAARVIAKLDARQRNISEERALRTLISGSKGCDRGLYQMALVRLLLRYKRDQEAMALYRKIAEEHRGTHLAVSAIGGLRAMQNPME